MEEQPPQPVVIILVGASGAGKSSWVPGNRNKIEDPLIDLDAIKNSLGDPTSDLHWELAQAARDRMIEILIRKRKSFTYETTYAYDEGVERFKEIVREGFIGKAIYFDAGSVKQSIERVRSRTEDGGHPVKEEDIRLHYVESAKNIRKNIEDFQEIEFIDTSKGIARNVALWTPQKGIQLRNPGQEIKWLQKFSALRTTIKQK